MSIPPGSRLGPYEIVSPIGAGGMGEVFLARDTRLERRVAIKILPQAFGTDEERKGRFTREAQAASAINHPNVAAIYDVGESQGVSFIAMELVDGRTLADRIAAGSIPLKDVIDFAMQIAEALEAAHASGVVHRDIKPANLMITARGRVKVLDFGLARQTLRGDTGATSLAVTSPGLVVGTIAYMSPEQAMGQPIDHRSDLFSLGVVLYQAASGQLPFGGETDLQVLSRIAHAEPDPIARPDDGTIAGFERIVRQCLRKNPDQRYQSAHDLLIDLRNLSRDIAEGRTGGAPIARRHNLPEQLTTFVGRQEELERLRVAMMSTRLLTLTGSGGCGKTRLALELGVDLVPRFPDGVWLVDLSPLSNAELLPQTIAETLTATERPGRSVKESLVEHLREKQLILLLDNCEHLVESCAEVTDLLLRSAPRLRILATSREALNVPGENVWRVPSLGVPQDGSIATGEIRASEAVRLFVDRAASMASFSLTDADALPVARVCRRLDGIPLAIELAAARVSVLTVGQIDERLSDRFRLLTGGGRTAVARQRTLEATVEWSHDLLGEGERRLFRRLSIFAGGWTLPAAEDVCSRNGLDRADVVDLLSRLVDKSLVMVEDSAGGERRYRLLETIRQFSRDRLIAAGEIDALNEQHFNFFKAFVERAEPELGHARQVAWLDRLQSDHDNIRAALDWANATGSQAHAALDLVARLWWFWVKRGHFSEGQRRLEAVLTNAPDAAPATRAIAYVGLMHCTAFRGDPSAVDVLSRSLDAARLAADPWCEAFALGFQAIVASDRGEFADAGALANQAFDLSLTIDVNRDQFNQPQALALRMLAYGALQRGEIETSSTLFERSIDLQRTAGESWSLGILLSDLAALRALQSRYGEARTLAHEAIQQCEHVGDRRGIAWCLQTIAMVDAADGHPTRAARLYGAAESLLAAVGATGQITVTRIQDQFLARAIEALGDRAFQAAVTNGRALGMGEAIEVAAGRS